MGAETKELQLKRHNAVAKKDTKENLMYETELVQLNDKYCRRKAKILKTMDEHQSMRNVRVGKISVEKHRISLNYAKLFQSTHFSTEQDHIKESSKRKA